MFRVWLLLTAVSCAPLGLAQRSLVHADAPLEGRGLVALVVGNKSYRQSPLVNPVNDARGMRDALAELGFAVELVTDADYKKLGSSIDRFTSRLRRGDVAVFFYAGHGMQIDGENYLVPTDFDARDEASAKYAAYPADRLVEGMERSGAKLNVIILDACRNNPYRGSRALGGGLAAMGAGTGTFVALATSPGKTASDNSKGANGLFTAHLLDSLKQPGLTLDEVFNRTRAQVFAASNKAQTPWSQTNVIGQFYFRPTAATAAEGKLVASSGAATPADDLAGAKRSTPVADPAYRQVVRKSRGGEPANAIDAFTQAIRANPDNTDAYYERAMTYAALGQFQRSIEDFDQALRRNLQDANALIGRAAALINIDDYARAVTDLDAVIAQEPENEIAYFDRGLAYAGLAQHQQAINDYTQVIRRRPKWPSTWYSRGMARAVTGDFKGAIEDYSEAVRLRPDYATAYANRGVTRAELGQFPLALTDLDEAIRLQPGDAAMLNNRGLILLYMKQPAKALESFNEAIEINALLGNAWSNRADARRALGDEAGARADAKRAAELGGR